MLSFVRNNSLNIKIRKEVVMTFCFLYFFFRCLPFPNLELTTPGTYKPNSRGSDACRGSNSLWTRTLDGYTRAGIPECVVRTMSGPPPETTQDNTDKEHTPNPRIGFKFLTPPGIEGRDSTDHATTTDPFGSLQQIIIS